MAQQFYRKSAYSPDDALLLYTKNPTFRRYANQAAAVLSGMPRTSATQAENDDGRGTAVAAANASTEIGNLYATPKFPHPALVLSWVVALGENARAIDSGFKRLEGSNPSSMTILPDSATLLSLVRSFKVPATLTGHPGIMQGKWLRSVSALSGTADRVPYWLAEKVSPMGPPGTKSGAFQGNRLRSITIAVPSGAKSATPIRMKQTGLANRRSQDAVAVPSRVEAVTLDLRSPLVAALYGEIWLCASKDRKSLFLAAEKSHKLRFEEFLQILSSGTGGGGVPSVLTQLPMEKEAMKKFARPLADSFRQRVSAAEVGQRQLARLDATRFQQTDK